MDQRQHLDLSISAISQAHDQVAAALKAPVTAAAAAAATRVHTRVLRVDETRYRREGSANWAWGVIQTKRAVFSIQPSGAR